MDPLVFVDLVQLKDQMKRLIYFKSLLELLLRLITLIIVLGYAMLLQLPH